MSQFEERGYYLEREIGLMQEIVSNINRLHGMFAEYEAPGVLNEHVRLVEGNQGETTIANILYVLEHCNTLLGETIGMTSDLDERLRRADIKVIYGPPSAFGIDLGDKLTVFSLEDGPPNSRKEEKYYKVLCPLCGEKIRPSTKFCSCCGTDLSNYSDLEQSDETYDVDETLCWCDSCRGTVAYYDKYCGHCGKNLHDK